MKNIAIFASGSGSNAENLIKHFSNNDCAKVVLVLSNKADAFVLERAAKLNVPSVFFERDDFYNSDKVLRLLQEYSTDFIVLAGFLWLIPVKILQKFPRRIVNIHPALLPGYGGKGMYGEKVHKAVIANGERKSGITIHYVNERYDEGDIIFQAEYNLEEAETAESLASKIHELEYRHFPVVVEELLRK